MSQVEVDGVWGFVCDDDFGFKVADLVCRDLGYSYAERFTRNNHFGDKSPGMYITLSLSVCSVIIFPYFKQWDWNIFVIYINTAPPPLLNPCHFNQTICLVVVDKVFDYISSTHSLATTASSLIIPLSQSSKKWLSTLRLNPIFFTLNLFTHNLPF